MSYKIITDPAGLARLGWKELVDGHPEGTVFQSGEMYELFMASGKMKPVVIGAADERNGTLAGILLGIETDIPPALSRAFQNTGTAHYRSRYSDL